MRGFPGVSLARAFSAFLVFPHFLSRSVHFRPNSVHGDASKKQEICTLVPPDQKAADGLRIGCLSFFATTYGDGLLVRVSADEWEHLGLIPRQHVRVEVSKQEQMVLLIVGAEEILPVV